MAEVMITLPDELLARLDAHARYRRRSRGDLLRNLAEREIAVGAGERRRRLAQLLASPGDYDGQGTSAVRAARDAR